MSNIHWNPLPIDGTLSRVHCLDGGSFIALWSFIHAGADNSTFRLYNWAFHIHDIKTNRHVLWDAGISSDANDYPPWTQNFMAGIKAVGPRVSLGDQLAKRNVNASNIDSVVFSHAHWDHCRPLSKSFPRARMYFGPGTKEFCSPGHFEDPENSQWDGRFFDPVRSTHPFEELSGPWVKLGPFEKAFDFFGTGSFWVVQAPGHMPGNLCAVVHQEDGEWIVLGSDCCHSRALLDGRKEIATWKLPNGSTTSLQADLRAAKDTMARIRIMEKELGAHIALAHDTEWVTTDTDSVLLDMLNDDMKASAKTKISNDEVL